MRYFHVYADGKTVKEVSWKKYRKLVMSDRSITAAKGDGDSWIQIRKGAKPCSIQIEQLRKILEA